jgi:hypothetical protein
MLKADTFGDRTIHKDMDQTVARRSRDQPLHLERRDVQSIANLVVSHAARKIEPRRPRHQALLVLGGRRIQRSPEQSPHPVCTLIL